MNMTDDYINKVRSIIANGGSFIMHKNDADRLREASKAGNRPDIFKGVKIYVDKIGCVQEGKPITAMIGGDKQAFGFGDCLKVNNPYLDDNKVYGAKEFKRLYECSFDTDLQEHKESPERPHKSLY